ncbi:uncharacterized protein PV09_06972 [Verruconis gallopava]|uniref:Uncharacterized protein n=1 Tax=Verruconis gallopava TaxID=253628 RepID=A0A0D1YL14_9PEZI|nr:uncharacterized protein PV09_06972 [Verruconis gallopava]KIW01492.1 hypothetical protein PV09_06972 [Verruconis gallopava]
MLPKMKEKGDFIPHYVQRPHLRRKPSPLTIVLSILLGLNGIHYLWTWGRPHSGHINQPGGITPSLSQISYIVKALYEPLLVSVTADEITTEDQHKHTLEKIKPWTTPSNSRLCILDIETDRQKPRASERIWRSPPTVHPGTLNHYIYARIHGYSYKSGDGSMFMQSSSDLERVLFKVEELFREQCQTVVLVDAALGFSEMNLPIEWLFNRWEVTKETPFAFAYNPEQRETRFPGLMIIQNVANGEGLAAARNCLDTNGQDIGCRKVVNILQPDIPLCTRGYDCVGTFMRYSWTSSDLEHVVFGGGVVKDLVGRLSKEYSDVFNLNEKKKKARPTRRRLDDELDLLPLIENHGTDRS